MKRYLSIDIGGTAIKYGLMTETADILEKHEMATEAHQGGLAILEKVKSLVATYQEAGLAGVAISSAGMVDPDKGNIFYAGPQIPNYAGTQLDRKSTRLNSSHANISYAVFCLKKKKKDMANTAII